ncbi:DUF2589 domain-containing protein [Aureisphaera galaxeae]|uniref:DUF2589 domain-containing protein n=1 Tax=Aureisphaera galaxeae TaxID=1538023 RepID=UPI002350C43E|nr:DUF2589 domain-containing protein [Aureisphaera galaxeae]MDC8004702.1 DUF2589 domain-containing protein [Aureisphaera galaxeae]
MIHFDNFVKAIHHSAIAANKTIMDENLKLLDTYFERSGDMESGKSIEDIMQAAEKVASKTHPTKAELEEVVQGLVDSKRAVIGDENDLNTNTWDTLTPKTIVVEIPEQTPKGVVMKKVNVPLIALIPISVSKISEIRFKTDLEILVENDDLKVGFPKKEKEHEGLSQLPTSTLEITINPDETAAGLKELILGYEKVLRAQIPN